MWVLACNLVLQRQRQRSSERAGLLASMRYSASIGRVESNWERHQMSTSSFHVHTPLTDSCAENSVQMVSFAFEQYVKVRDSEFSYAQYWTMKCALKDENNSPQKDRNHLHIQNLLSDAQAHRSLLWLNAPALCVISCPGKVLGFSRSDSPLLAHAYTSKPG